MKPISLGFSPIYFYKFQINYYLFTRHDANGTHMPKVLMISNYPIQTSFQFSTQIFMSIMEMLIR